MQNKNRIKQSCTCSDMARAMIAMFIVSFFFVFVSFTAGVRGCWKTSPTDITASAVLMLIACKYPQPNIFALCAKTKNFNPSMCLTEMHCTRSL